MTRRVIPRKRLEMWLRLDKRSEVELLYDIIPTLKREQQFSSAVRDGLRLVWELRQGKTDYLFQLFPFVKVSIQTDLDAALSALISGLMTSQNPTAINPLPPASVPLVVKVDETKARQVTLQNTISSLEDF